MSTRRRKRRIDFEVPHRAPRTRCRYCNAEIVWITTGERPDGSPKRMPLDVRSIWRDLAGDERAESHFAHCPHARVARRGGAA